MRRIAVEQRAEIEAARVRGANLDEIHQIGSRWASEHQLLSDEHEQLYTRRLTRQAYRLRVRVPTHAYGPDAEENEYWQRGTVSGLWYLKDEGIRKVREEIRAERRARSEQLLPWFTLFVGLVVGALTALATVWARS